jgi:peroxiredoxin
MRASILFCACLLAGCSGSASSPSTAASSASSETSDATDFTLTDTEGKQVSLSQYLGKQAIVVDFWATWCKPCVAELSHLQKVYQGRKDKGLVILAVSMDGPETESMVTPFVKGKGWTFPVLIDTETRATSLYNPRKAAPFTIVIDRHGKIVKRREGFNPGDEVQLEADVDAALAP